MLEARRKRKRRREPLFSAGVRKWSLYALYLAAAGLLTAGGLVVANLIPTDDANRQIISAGQGFVRDAIREELRTNFADDEETQVEPLPGNKFLVAGWVDVMNEEGGVARQNFSCVISRNASDEWVGEKITVIPQQL